MQATACSRTGVKVMDAVKFARQLRRNESKAETIFWNAVRNRQFLNLKFRRQVPIDKYFADFVCEEKKIIIDSPDVATFDLKPEMASGELTKKLLHIGLLVKMPHKKN